MHSTNGPTKQVHNTTTDNIRTQSNRPSASRSVVLPAQDHLLTKNKATQSPNKKHSNPVSDARIFSDGQRGLRRFIRRNNIAGNTFGTTQFFRQLTSSYHLSLWRSSAFVFALLTPIKVRGNRRFRVQIHKNWRYCVLFRDFNYRLSGVCN